MGKMADTTAKNHPHGMEPYDVAGDGDLGALSKDQQAKLNRFKVRIAGVETNLVSIQRQCCLTLSVSQSQ